METYFVIGPDGTECGPFTLIELQEWQRQGQMGFQAEIRLGSSDETIPARLVLGADSFRFDQGFPEPSPQHLPHEPGSSVQAMWRMGIPQNTDVDTRPRISRRAGYRAHRVARAYLIGAAVTVAGLGLSAWQAFRPASSRHSTALQAARALARQIISEARAHPGRPVVANQLYETTETPALWIHGQPWSVEYGDQIRGARLEQIEDSAGQKLFSVVSPGPRHTQIDCYADGDCTIREEPHGLQTEDREINLSSGSGQAPAAR